MAFPRDDGQYRLDCDASNLAIGAVLSQVQDGEERVIAYASRLYSKSEKNYCVTRKELLAMVYFTKHFRQYLLGRPFLIRTDHSALLWLRKTPEPIGQQGRWLEILEGFDFSVEHRPGRHHTNADALSRIPCGQCGQEDESVDVVGENSCRMIRVEEAVEPFDRWSSAQMAEQQKGDPQIGEFYRLKLNTTGEKPSWEEMIHTSECTKALWNQWDNIVVKAEVLYKIPFQNDGDQTALQLIPPMSVRKEIMCLAHTGMTGGHLGIARTKAQIRRRAYWPGWSSQVCQFCRSCELCARYKRGRAPKQGLMQPIPVGEPFEIVSLDVTGPHPKSSRGHVYILTVMDQFTKWANQEASTIGRILMDQVFSRLGMPKQILTDQGSNFDSSLFQELCRSMGFDKI